MDIDEYALSIIRPTLDDPTMRLSQIVRQAIRVAQLMSDHVSAWWLEWELVDILDEHQRVLPLASIYPHLTADDLRKRRQIFGEAWMKEREITVAAHDAGRSGSPSPTGEPKILAKSVSDIESSIDEMNALSSQLTVPQGLAPLDLYYSHRDNTKAKVYLQAQIQQYTLVLDRIRERVYRYLRGIEAQIVFGQVHSDIFRDNLAYVQRALAERAPEAIDQFLAAYDRMSDSSAESWAQALVSCRRLLKTLADGLYPPQSAPVIGTDGKCS